MAQLNDLIVNGYTRFLNSAYGNLNGSATSALCAAYALNASPAAHALTSHTDYSTHFTNMGAAKYAIEAGVAPVGQHEIANNFEYPMLLKWSANQNRQSAYVHYTSSIFFNPSTHQFKLHDIDEIGGWNLDTIITPINFEICNGTQGTTDYTAVKFDALKITAIDGSTNNNAFWTSLVKVPSYFTNESAKSSINSTTVTWSSGSNNTYRPIGFADADNQSDYSTNKTFNGAIVYDKNFTFNPSTDTMVITNVSCMGDISALDGAGYSFYCYSGIFTGLDCYDSEHGYYFYCDNGSCHMHNLSTNTTTSTNITAENISAKNVITGIAKSAECVWSESWTSNSARPIRFGQNANSYSSLGFDPKFTYNPSTDTLSCERIVAGEIASRSGIYAFACGGLASFYTSDNYTGGYTGGSYSDKANRCISNVIYFAGNFDYATSAKIYLPHYWKQRDTFTEYGHPVFDIHYMNGYAYPNSNCRAKRIIFNGINDFNCAGKYYLYTPRLAPATQGSNWHTGSWTAGQNAGFTIALGDSAAGAGSIYTTTATNLRFSMIPVYNNNMAITGLNLLVTCY
jgi:hypothetical protein